MRFINTSPPHRWYRLVLAVLLGFLTSLALTTSAEACHGSVVIEKVETGQLAPGGTYDITISGTTEAGQDYTTTVSVPHDQQVTIPRVPAGTYDVSEANASAGTVISPSSFTIETDREEVFITVTNPFPGGKLAIEKVETGETAPGGPYTFNIAGPGGYTNTVDVMPGTRWTSEWLLLGSYTVTEVDPPAGHELTPNPAVIDADGETVLVTATNPYPDRTGRIAIEKIETGETAPGGTYEFQVDGPESFTATVPAGGTYTSDPLPLGEYTITEVDAPAGHTISPNPVTIDEDGETVLVTATNPYRDFHGRLAIEKVETGDTAPGGEYTFTVAGPGGSTDTVVVAAGDVWTSDWLPLGTYTVTELDAPAGHTISPNPVTIDEDGETVLVTATNPYRDFHGRLAIEKGGHDGGNPNALFEFTVTGPASFTAVVEFGVTWTSDWLPLGTYTVTEADAPDGHTIVPNPVTIDDDGETVLVTVTNPQVLPDAPTAKIAIQKVETGPSAPDGTYRFTIRGEGKTVAAEVRAGSTWTSGDLPLGTYTIVEEFAPPGHTIVPNPVVLDDDGETVLVIATNNYPEVLPATGGGNPVGLLGVGGLLVAAGMAALTVRRVRLPREPSEPSPRCAAFDRGEWPWRPGRCCGTIES
jgi:uncharacterized surface anchored protein